MDSLLSNVQHSLGTKRERGLLEWNEADQFGDSNKSMASEELYDLPLGITSCLSSQSWVRFIPFCPQHNQKRQEEMGVIGSAL